MSKCAWQKDIMRYFDGEAANAAAVEAHLETCAPCAAELRALRAVRSNVAPIVRHEEVGAEQFPAFMAGIRENMDGSPPRRWGLWTWVTAGAVAATVLFGVALWMSPDGGAPELPATLVISCSTEIEGATVSSYASQDGVMTLCVNMPEDGVW